MAITRFNSSFCFSKIFFRERSSPPPPNFASPFCAFCLIVCDFLPKTWNLGRKGPPQSRCARQIPLFVTCGDDFPRSGGSRPSRGRLSALPQSFPPPLKPSPWGRWLDAKRQDGRGSPPDSGLALSGAPRRATVSAGNKRGSCRLPLRPLS